MRKIQESDSGELAWVQPSRIKQVFELRSGDEVVGGLTWKRSTLATGSTADHEWTFKREGFWHPQVTVRVAGSDANVALFRPHWAGGGILEIEPGKQFRLGAANFWHSQWDWLDAGEKPVVHFKSRQGLLKMEGGVEIEPDAASSPDRDLLVVLGWYLLILFAHDATTASATATVVAAH
jgi:hypothetical protein